jgi:predicted adenine nucleotide alpha hydrolase (AANH) superfamily ATPase
MNVVLHICCGVCAAGAAKQLMDEGHQVTGFFFNPNIHPEEEYKQRLEAVEIVAKELNFPLVLGKYEPAEWLKQTESLAAEKEGGKRCELCYKIRLRETVDCTIKTGAEAFTTTLTIGPQKKASIINAIGQEIGGDKFLARNFKKKDGYKKANETAKKLEIYRQHYCGCIYSRRDKVNLLIC